MNPVTKNRSLVSIIIFLLITNLAMLVFFVVLNKPAPKNSRERDKNGMSGMLQKEVGFTKEQVNTYLSLRKNHFDTVHILFDELRKTKTDFYNLIYTPQVSDSFVIQASGLIAEKQKVLDLKMFNYFKRVRNICTAGQLQKFDTTIKKVLTRMTGKAGRGGHDQ